MIVEMRRSSRDRKPVERFKFQEVENADPNESEDEDIDIPKQKRRSKSKESGYNSDQELVGRNMNAQNKRTNKQVASKPINPTVTYSDFTSQNYIFGNFLMRI